MDEMSIEAARPKLGEIIDRVRFTGQPVRITRAGKPGAIVVNVDWYEAAIGFLGEFRPNLSRFEIVHKDGDPRNNDPGNLALRERPK